MPHCYRLSGQKWIPHPDFVVILTVVQVFGIKCGANQFSGDLNSRGSNLSLLKSIHGNPLIRAINIKRTIYIIE